MDNEITDAMAEDEWVCPSCGAHFAAPDREDMQLRFEHRCHGQSVTVEIVARRRTTAY